MKSEFAAVSNDLKSQKVKGRLVEENSTFGFRENQPRTNGRLLQNLQSRLDFQADPKERRETKSWKAKRQHSQEAQALKL